MSSTRHKSEGDPLRIERWMSSPEYVEQRGIAANMVAAKAALQSTDRKKKLLFWLQAMSMKPGGFVKLAGDLIAEFPERIGTATMRRLALKPGQKYSHKDAEQIDGETHFCFGEHDENDELYTHDDFTAAGMTEFCASLILKELPGFLKELCAKPEVIFRDPDEIAAGKKEKLGIHPFLNCFDDITGALFEFQRRYADNCSKEFVMTVVGKEVFARLDKALHRGKIVVIEGLEGRGKSEATKAWCEQHLGEARYVDLTGNNNMTSFFRSIARACGLAAGETMTTTQMQSRIEDFLPRSGLLLVIDEAHFLFPVSDRGTIPPKMLDWIDTALMNRGVTVALITTPQFGDRMQNTVKRTGWNFKQFQRRLSDWKTLPTKLPECDLEAVARKLAPKAPANVAKYLAFFAHAQEHQLDTLANTIAEAKLIASQAGRADFNFHDIKRAIAEEITPTFQAKAEVFAEPKSHRKAVHEERPTGICKPMKQPVQSPCTRFESPPQPAQPAEEEGAGDLHNRLFNTEPVGA